MSDDERVLEAWCECVRHSFSLAKGEEAGRLRGKRSRTFNERGTHPLSFELGRVSMLQDLWPWLRDAEFDPLAMRSLAAEEALAEFVADVREGAWP